MLVCNLFVKRHYKLQLAEKDFYLNIALNWVSSPPIPILLKSQSGFIIWVLSTFPLLFPVRLRPLPSIFSQQTGVLARSSPQVTL